MTDIRLALPSPRRTPGREGSPLRPWRGLSAAIAFLGLAGCADDSSTKGDALTAAEVEPIVANYIAIVRASYDDAITGTSALDGAIEAFLDGPSEANLVAARQAWLDVRETYGQTETYRFYDGPIDDPDTGPEGRINGWPLDEAFIDYVVDDDGAGIINHTDDFPMISQQVVADENENGSETNISSGYHAIEFLLWGQDLSATGPGARPYTDYVTGEDGTAANQDRRSAYIAAASGLLLEDLASVRAAWNDGGGTYAAEFAALEPKEAVRRMFAGIGVMAGFELPGERMAAAFDNKDQEDEHSCFSDNTHRDIYTNALGVQNVYLGRYGNIDGPGLDELLEARDPELNAKLKDQIQTALDDIEEIPTPFDAAITSENGSDARDKIQTAIRDLQDVAETLVEAGKVLGVDVAVL